MTAATIIEQLDKLIRLHENLLRLAGDKTEAIKKNDMEKVEIILSKMHLHFRCAIV